MVADEKMLKTVQALSGKIVIVLGFILISVIGFCISNLIPLEKNSLVMVLFIWHMLFVIVFLSCDLFKTLKKLERGLK